MRVFAAHNTKTCHGCGNETNAISDTSVARRRALTTSLLNDTEVMCDVCRVYGQDYVCLGYAFPEACRREACLGTLPPRLQAALRLL